jgi:hypothetical protein
MVASLLEFVFPCSEFLDDFLYRNALRLRQIDRSGTLVSDVGNLLSIARSDRKLRLRDRRKPQKCRKSCE